MNRYAKGRRLEYRIMRLLEADGYKTLRSAGSHGLYDIVAWKEDDVRFIQAKHKPYVTRKEIEKIEKDVMPAKCRREIWFVKDRRICIHEFRG